jgi:hypothetical protein
MSSFLNSILTLTLKLTSNVPSPSPPLSLSFYSLHTGKQVNVNINKITTFDDSLIPEQFSHVGIEYWWVSRSDGDGDGDVDVDV